MTIFLNLSIILLVVAIAQTFLHLGSQNTAPGSKRQNCLSIQVD
ncbi:hypothetical protein QX233_13250 [Chryseobacterium gambrini]|uniref:Uncharacterized protein n=1 Tax=Chryseobacterium gambrini TaxID=373672 RepID=A0AAJ1R6Z7_9FLAO|nr:MULTISPECIES: hypothetical protein [Chryseobacterium]MDN4013437.1 hypothetical protein [Chryseobacterium gambrini]